MTDPVYKVGHRPLTPGTKLADRINALGYTVMDVTRGTGISRYQINDYLLKRKKPTPRQLHRLVRFLDCEPEAIQE